MKKMTTEEYEAMLAEKAYLEMRRDEAIERKNNPPQRRPNEKKYELIATDGISVSDREVFGCQHHKKAMMISICEDPDELEHQEKDSFVYAINDIFLNENQSAELLGQMMKVMFRDEKMSNSLRRYVNEYYAKCRDQLGNELGITDEK